MLSLPTSNLRADEWELIGADARFANRRVRVDTSRNVASFTLTAAEESCGRLVLETSLANVLRRMRVSRVQVETRDGGALVVPLAEILRNGSRVTSLATGIEGYVLDLPDRSRTLSPTEEQEVYEGLVKTQDVADALKVSLQTIRKWTREGIISPKIRVNSRVWWWDLDQVAKDLERVTREQTTRDDDDGSPGADREGTD